MAKKAIKKSSDSGRESIDDLSTQRSASKRGSKSSKGGSSTMDRDYKDVLKDLASSPAVRYVAGGIAAAVLSRIASNLSERYPELSNFIKENLDNVEGRLGDFRNNLGESVRH